MDKGLSEMAARIASGRQVGARDVQSALDECGRHVNDIWAAVYSGRARADAGTAADAAFAEACWSATAELLRAKALIERIWVATRTGQRKWETKCESFNTPKS